MTVAEQFEKILKDHQLIDKEGVFDHYSGRCTLSRNSYSDVNNFCITLNSLGIKKNRAILSSHGCLFFWNYGMLVIVAFECTAEEVQ